MDLDWYTDIHVYTITNIIKLTRYMHANSIVVTNLLYIWNYM